MSTYVLQPSTIKTNFSLHVHLLHRSPANCMIVKPFITMFPAHLKPKMSPMDINLVILGTCREEHGTEGYSGSNEDYGCRLLIYTNPKEIRVYPTTSIGHCSWIAQLCGHIRHRICLKKTIPSGIEIGLRSFGGELEFTRLPGLDNTLGLATLHQGQSLLGEWRTGGRKL